MKKVFIGIYVIFCFKLLFIGLFAQNNGIGAWSTHLSYNRGVGLAIDGNFIYGASSSGVFRFNKQDNSIEKLTKTEGFSGIEVSSIAFNKEYKTLVIAYKDANIDLLKGNEIINIPDIKRKQILGNKAVNDISFFNQYAYLACGFGIVVLDLDRKEIKDTYYLGSNASYVNINTVVTDGVKLYAGTDVGLYEANYNSSNLSDNTSWLNNTQLPTSKYNTMHFFNGKLFANISLPSNNTDTLYCLNNNVWNKVTLPFSTGYKVQKIKSVANTLIITYNGFVHSYDNNMQVQKMVFQYIFSPGYVGATDALVDEESNFWIADNRFGLVWAYDSYHNKIMSPNGPNSSNVDKLVAQSGFVYVSHGARFEEGGKGYVREGISYFNENSWSAINKAQSILNLDSVTDILDFAVDKINPTHFYASTWESDGVLEFEEAVLKQKYSSLNSALSDNLRVGPIALDGKNNLWVSASFTPFILSVKKNTGQWQSFDFTSFTGEVNTVKYMLITSSGQKWMAMRSGGILVYQDNGSFQAPNASNVRVINTQEGSGKLPNKDVFSMVEDKDGAIWIGTGEGLVVFYSPEAIFSEDNWDASEVFVQQDGRTQKLLATEVVTAIAVDGGNRKWIGTYASGAFLMSEDGTKQISYFNENNSALISNEIKDIAINHVNGEVFFATSKGIVSYNGTATEAAEDYSSVLVYPNPVKKEYEGLIAIKGLVNNSEIRITDVSGELVYITQSEGGMAVWDGKNFKGKRVATGIYLVFCTSSDAAKNIVAKIQIIN